MLDIRAIAYVSPLAEVEFTDVPLTVRLSNLADETGYVTGLFRVYNDTTSELIHSSEIAPLTLAAGEHADASALTDFSPPAPLDDTYFVCFSGQAANPLVPRGISFFLGAFHFDVKPGPLGEPPEAHAPTHEQAGADPIETEDLGTAELDDTLVLSPDGAGGLQWQTPPGAKVDIQVFTSNGNWLKPANAKAVLVQVIGAGGGGGGGVGDIAGTARVGGAGGGAGALAQRLFAAAVLAASVPITIGTGGTGGAGGNPGAGAPGTDGGRSQFGNTQKSGLWSFGGGGGNGATVALSSIGAGGGGTAGAGATAGTGGTPGASSSTAVSGSGAAGVIANPGGRAEFGGAAGGGGRGAVDFATDGGSSLYGPGGGANGGGVRTTNIPIVGGSGGAHGSYTAGGGGAPPGGNGADGDGYTTCGDGGGGANGNAGGPAGNGGNGGSPGAGGAGGGGGLGTGGNGGNGGRGEVRVYTFY